MMHPHTRLNFINEQVGYGVFATAPIPAGTITYVADALEIAIPAESALLQNSVYRSLIDKYATVEPGGQRLVSWDIAKYVNHCCHCNTMSTGYGFEIALRDIAPGEEITDEYGLFNLEWEMNLACSHANCRRRLQRSDFDTFAAVWDAQIQAVLPCCLHVEQPLWSLLDGSTLADLIHFLATGEGYKSVTALRSKAATDNGRYLPTPPDTQFVTRIP